MDSTDFFEMLENKIREDIPISMETAIENAQPIWKILNLTEEEYNEKYNKSIETPIKQKADQETEIIKELETVSIEK